MSQSKTVSVEAIIEQADNITQSISKIDEILSLIEINKSTIKENCNNLNNYNNTKVPNTTVITTNETTYQIKEEYNIWQITGQNEIISSLEGLDSITNDIITLKEELNNMIVEIINSTLEIEGAKEKIEELLSTYQIHPEAINPSLYKLLKKYTTTSNELTYPEIENDGFIPQGITTIDGCYYVTAYKKGENSRIYIFDQETGKLNGEVILNSKAHVGGISYDKQNGIIYVAGTKGEVDTYNYTLMKEQFDIKNPKVLNLNLNTVDNSNIIIKNNITIKEKQENNPGSIKTKVGATSTLTYKDNELYIGTFDGVNDGELVKYNINLEKDKNGNITNVTATSPTISNIPNQTQGITIANYNDKEYLLTTQSIGITTSQVTMYEKNGTDLNYVGTASCFPKGLEGITVDQNQVTMVYENNQTTDTMTTNIEDLYNKCSSGKYNPTPITRLSKYAGGQIYNKQHNID